MAHLLEMLTLCEGSFARAEQMALEMIVKGGRTEVYLDLSLLLHAQGKIDGAKQTLELYAKTNPNSSALQYAQKYFQLMDGDLQAGSDHVEIGRSMGILAPERGLYVKPRWVGQVDVKGKTVVLDCEGGLGDQIMQVRFATHLSAMGAKVIVDCSPELGSLLSRSPCVTSVVCSEAGKRDSIKVHHDYHVMAMNAFGALKCTWDTLWPGQYVNAQDSDIWSRIIPKTPGVLNVGLRWAGNPLYENQQLRRFPVELMFNLTKIPGIKFWSLQKGEPTILPPEVTDLEPFLSTFEQTASAIKQMDMVISSCTSIAHLAGAMNVPTCIVIPAMSYHPWARPGNKSSWYPSVILFRQKCYGDWKPPFDALYRDLQAKQKGARS